MPKHGAKYEPQLPSLVDLPPDGDRWLHELKHDGYRMGVVLDGGRARLISRNGNDWTAALPEVAAATSALGVASAVLDGEVAILLPDGRSSFQALQNAFSGAASARTGLVYLAFDLLELDGQDLTREPLVQRKARLQQLVREKAPPRSLIRYCDHVVGHGPAVYAQALKLGAEGVVSKRVDAPYRPGRSRDWLKTKSARREDFVVGGFTEPGGTGRAGVGALLLGQYDDTGLVYSGKVGTGKGWTAEFLSQLRTGLEQLEQEACGFSTLPPRDHRHGAHWTRPQLVVEVQFGEWTSDGHVRHPSFCGFRPDTRPSDVRRDVRENDRSPG